MKGLSSPMDVTSVRSNAKYFFAYTRQKERLFFVLLIARVCMSYRTLPYCNTGQSNTSLYGAGRAVGKERGHRIIVNEVIVGIFWKACGL